MSAEKEKQDSPHVFFFFFLKEKKEPVVYKKMCRDNLEKGLAFQGELHEVLSLNKEHFCICRCVDLKKKKVPMRFLVSL